jgi:NAD(P)-dependent dehydrogenase (short-subunit alcohol dehydrogenase family)
VLLEGKVCIVAGAGSDRGIGFSTMELFARHGATVLGCDLVIDPKRRTALLDRINASMSPPAKADFVACDITKPEDCKGLVEVAVSRFGKVDGLVNCAGIVESCGTLDISQDSLARMLEVNLKGAFTLTQEVLRLFSTHGSGTIVNVASVAAQRGGGLVGGSHYAASKGGMISLTRSIAREFGPMGVRANVVCPSMTETGMLDGMGSAHQDKLTNDIPLRRTARPVDIAGACLFLTSDLSAYVTGATIDVNGGSHIH